MVKIGDIEWQDLAVGNAVEVLNFYEADALAQPQRSSTKV